MTIFNNIEKIDTPLDVMFEKCRIEFSVSHSGVGDNERHSKFEKHKNADRAAASSSVMFSRNRTSQLQKGFRYSCGRRPITGYKKTKVFAPMIINRNLFKHCFDQKFRCPRTKAEAVVVNDLARTAIKELKDDRGKTNCIAFLTDGVTDIDEEIVKSTTPKLYEISREYLQQKIFLVTICNI